MTRSRAMPVVNGHPWLALIAAGSALPLRGGGASGAVPEPVQPVAPETFVRALYLACLGREPEPEALATWLAQLRGPDGALQVAKQIQASPEARAHISAAPEPTPVAPEAFVRALYLACLGREPEPEALATWLAQLRGPDGALQVAKQIQASPEARAHISAAPEPTQADPTLVQVARAVLHLVDGYPGLALIAAGMERARVERLSYAYRVDRLWFVRVLRLELYLAIRLGTRLPGWADAAAWHARLLPALHKPLSLAYRRSLRPVGSFRPIDNPGPAQRRIQRRLELLRSTENTGSCT